MTEVTVHVYIFFSHVWVFVMKCAVVCRKKKIKTVNTWLATKSKKKKNLSLAVPGEVCGRRSRFSLIELHAGLPAVTDSSP